MVSGVGEPEGSPKGALEGRAPKGVKSIPPNTKKWLRKRYDENDDNNMSNETKRETDDSMNNK